eukprot:879687-Prorocentrum_minimum.AAC.1
MGRRGVHLYAGVKQGPAKEVDLSPTHGGGLALAEVALRVHLRVLLVHLPFAKMWPTSRCGMCDFSDEAKRADVANVKVWHVRLF